METKRFCFFCDNPFLGLGFSTLTATLLSLLTQTHRHPRTHTPTPTHARNGTGPIKARGPPKHAFGPSKGSSHGTVTARSRHSSHGTVTALSRHAVTARSRHCHGTPLFEESHVFFNNPQNDLEGCSTHPMRARHHSPVGSSKHPKASRHHWPRGCSKHPKRPGGWKRSEEGQGSKQNRFLLTATPFKNDRLVLPKNHCK